MRILDCRQDTLVEALNCEPVSEFWKTSSIQWMIEGKIVSKRQKSPYRERERERERKYYVLCTCKAMFHTKGMWVVQQKCCGTTPTKLKWAATGHNHTVDIYNLGVLLYDMLTGLPPPLPQFLSTETWHLQKKSDHWPGGAPLSTSICVWFLKRLCHVYIYISLYIHIFIYIYVASLPVYH